MFLSVMVIFLVGGVFVADVVGAQGACQAVTPINEYANIRSSAGVSDPSTGSGNNITGRLNRGEVACVDGPAPSTGSGSGSPIGSGGGWYHLTAGGYISASVVTVVTVEPTPRQAGLTPTRLVTNTPLASATPIATPSPTPVLLRVCIIYGKDERVCSIFSEPVSVTIERVP